MIAYAESSAVLTWLLGERREEDVRLPLSEAERVVSSTLTSALTMVSLDKRIRENAALGPAVAP